MIKIGDKAPGFSLYDSAKNKVSLSDFKGKNVVILFFPQAFSGTCTAELCSVRDELKDYESLNAEVLAISVDSFFTLAKFKELQNYNFLMLSDFNKEVSALYGAIYDTWINDMKGVSKRAAFLIDKEGIIQYAEVLEKASDLPNLNALKEKLANLR